MKPRPPYRPGNPPRYGQFLLLPVVSLILAIGPGSWIAAGDEGRTPEPRSFELDRQVLNGRADWISWGQDVVTFGSDRDLTVAAVEPEFSVKSTLSLDAPVVHGVVAGTELYLIQRFGSADRLTAIDLDAIETPPRSILLRPEPGASIHLGRMDDYLIVAEDGHGLRILELPGHQHHDDPMHGHSLSPTQVGFLPLQERFSAVAASLRWIHVSADSGLIVIDASVPEVPKFVRRLPLDVGAEVRALSANGSRVSLLSETGLHIVDVSRTGEAATPESYPEVLGRAMNVAGRQLYVADGDAGVRLYRDNAAPAATFFVQVGDIFFNPPGVVNVNVGDTVEWQKSTTGFPHNVFSCNPGQAGCGGATTTEVFTSGPVTTSPFNFSRAFTLAGNNPYVCQAHAFSMQGDIVVTGGPPSPPGVPDGSAATSPTTVGKLDPAGVDLRIAYDTGCPGATGHDIIHGTSVHLPVAPGGTFASAGGRCGIGTTSPFVWTATPPPSSGDFAWWLILAEDGSGTEGSWGKDSLGSERDGAGVNGASGQCGNTNKDLSNACGQ